MPADPLDSLRQPIAPIAPDPDFAADLRRRLEVALDLTPEGAPMSTVSTTTSTGAVTAPAQPAVSVYFCARDAAAAIDFYQEAFGAVETLRMTADDGRIGHAELTIGGTTVMLSDEYPEIGVVSPESLGGTSVSLYLRVDDVDATYDRAVAAGATSERPPSDQFHGNRNATLRDPFGHRWMLTMPVEEVSLEEMAAPPPTTPSLGAIPRPQAPPGDRSASWATSPCPLPTSLGPRPSTRPCSAGTSNRRARARVATRTATWTTPTCPSASTRTWPTEPAPLLPGGEPGGMTARVGSWAARSST